ncbi:hypothetical protein [Lutispora saccharofermentans]|uniref:Uncharacterized protein n=1 Tax=Lutispora saccharofermentans TaxID=3024236 RepID=A0ABT1NBC8_9FIRM|nr:hypothetical protein [Lutispora saccharofermentans]MCQ1528563.1 hypothetical protein [Lutispora saccharofermentans]
MIERKLVKLKEFSHTPYSYEKLSYCLNCNTYTTLSYKPCISCGKSKFISLVKQTELITKKHYTIHNILIIMAFFTAIAFSANFNQILLSVFAAFAVLALQIFVQRLYYKKHIQYTLARIVREDIGKMKEDMEQDLQSAMKDFESENFKEAYESLREIGAIIQNDFIRELKIQCLKRFELRKDMDLELDTLIVEDYNEDLIGYIFEIIKLNNDLITKKVMDYIVRYEEQVLDERNGQAIIINTCEAMLKSKSYIDIYKDFIVKYIGYMRKNRLIRLCSLLASNNKPDWQDLYEETFRVIKEKYRGDADFGAYL